MPARLLVVGLDAMELRLVDAWADRGELPAFAELAASSTEIRLASCMSTLPGAVWPEINTGRSAETLALFHHPAQIHTGDAVPRPVLPADVDPRWDWWHVAGAAGCRTLVLDAPQSVPRPGAPGVQLCDWGTHDRTWAPAAEPPAALAEASARVGPHPIDACDARVRRGGVAAYRDLLDRLVTSVRARTALAEGWMARERWDVAHVVYAETHCVGHHFTGLRDPGCAPYVADAPDDLRAAVRTVYREIDAGLGRLLAAAGADARVVVVASHGMAKYVGGYQLLGEVLSRLGLRPGSNPVATGLSRRVPSRLRAAARRVVPTPAREQVLRALGDRPQDDLRDPRTRATVVPNNRCGAIRLNLRGREPHGCVEPGTEADEVVALLRRELRGLTDPRTGEPIVAAVDTPADSGRAVLHPDLPDVTVAFRTDLGPLEACTSPRVGLVEVPLWPRHPRRPDWPLGLGRTGDHTADSRIRIRAAGFAVDHAASSTADGAGGSLLDVAPTALTLLGVPVPDELEGRSLVTPAPVSR